MLETLLSIVHVLVCLALILIILLQTGKGAGMGAAFGGSSQTLFGSTGRATFLTKVTIAAAIIFGFSSLGLTLLSTGGSSLMDDYKPKPNVSDTPLPPPIPSAPGANVPILPPGEEGPGAMTPDETAPETPGSAFPALPGFEPVEPSAEPTEAPTSGPAMTPAPTEAPPAEAIPSSPTEAPTSGPERDEEGGQQ